MHCLACNSEFEPRINKTTGEDETLCSSCLAESMSCVYELEYGSQSPDEYLDEIAIYTMVED